MENLNFTKEEIWKDIPEFEKLYQASNWGRIRSLDRYVNNRHNTLSLKKGRILKPTKTCDGYYFVTLCKQPNKKNYRVNRLVWSAFNGSIPEGMQVNHINEIKTDNRLENLNLMTCKENNNWGSRTERMSKSQSNPVLQFTLEGILVKEYSSSNQVERETGFSQGHISDCCNGKRKTAYDYKWEYK